MLERSHHAAEVPEELVRQLADLGLCQASDFRSARRLVRRLSRDLPSFDSVWLDALVQQRALTPYQARQIELGSASQLVVGPYRLREQLGAGSRGQTWLADGPDRDRVVLKRLRLVSESAPDCHARLVASLNRASGIRHPHIVIPEVLLQPEADSLVTVSPWVSGLTVSELLVRRGRFPANVVRKIGCQLASGLAALHTRGLVHGDVRISNVRLTQGGRAVLVDGLTRPALCPEFTIHEPAALETCDTMAPELIGTGTAAHVGSEIYALGCLLWQLLAGRPPHMMADPLMKLAAHQCERIADVRTLAPETPAAIAELLLAMTAPDVNERPRTMDEVLRVWGPPTGRGRKVLRDYRQGFDGAIPHLAQQAPHRPRRRWPWLVALIFVTSGMALSLADRGFQTQLLTLTRQWASLDVPGGSAAVAGRPGDSPNSDAVKTAGGLVPLPAPSATGEIVLTGPGPYEVAHVTVDGPLTIRGVEGSGSEVRVSGEPWSLAAESVTLRNVRVTSDRSTANLAAMLRIKSQSLDVVGCHLALDDATAPDATRAPGILIAWRPLDPGAWKAHGLTLQDCVFRGGVTALWCAESPTKIVLQNTLSLVTGPFLHVSARARRQAMHLDLASTTLRQGGPLVRLPRDGGGDGPLVQIHATNCVFDLAASVGGLVELVTAVQADVGNTGFANDFAFQGQGSVINPDRALLAVSSTGREAAIPVDVGDSVTGIVISELVFAGEAISNPSASRLESLTAPRSAQEQLPGIDPRRLMADAIERAGVKISAARR